MRIVRSPVRFSDPAPTARADVPELGQHTEEVLLEAGYSWDEIAALAVGGCHLAPEPEHVARHRVARTVSRLWLSVNQWR